MKPALTAEEWAARECSNDNAGVLIQDVGSGDEFGVLFDSTLGWQYCDEIRHGIAALALHGQPFGFTWEDVDLLDNVEADKREIAATRSAQEAGLVQDFIHGAECAASLRARIAALLPPRRP